MKIHHYFWKLKTQEKKKSLKITRGKHIPYKWRFLWGAQGETIRMTADFSSKILKTMRKWYIFQEF
jgi:hypothetical protein